MQISRLFEIVYILLDKKKITAKELANHFEVSVRTIYRDIDALSSAGIPVYTNQGKGGGIALLEDFVLNKSFLSDKEQSDILIGLQNLSVIHYPDIDSILSRLSNLFQKKDNQWIEVDFSPWGSDEKHKEKFNHLKKAILNFQVITFDYFNSAGIKSSRHVEPMKLIFKDRAWYLIAYNYEKESYRTFRVTRMCNVQITDVFFNKRLSKESIPNITSDFSRNSINIQLKVSSAGAYRVFDDFYEKDILKNKDGSFTITASFPEGDWIYNYLLSFGPTLEDIRPISLRDSLINRLETMLYNISHNPDNN